MSAVTPDWLIEKLRREIREASREAVKFASFGGPDPNPKRTEAAKIRSSALAEVMGWCREAEAEQVTAQLNEKYKS